MVSRAFPVFTDAAARALESPPRPPNAETEAPMMADTALLKTPAGWGDINEATAFGFVSTWTDCYGRTALPAGKHIVGVCSLPFYFYFYLIYFSALIAKK